MPVVTKIDDSSDIIESNITNKHKARGDLKATANRDTSASASIVAQVKGNTTSSSSCSNEHTSVGSVKTAVEVATLSTTLPKCVPIKKFIVKAPKVRAIRDVETDEVICKPIGDNKDINGRCNHSNGQPDVVIPQLELSLDSMAPVAGRKLRSIHNKPARFISPADPRKIPSRTSIPFTSEELREDRVQISTDSNAALPGKSALKSVTNLSNEKLKRALTFKSPLANYQMVIKSLTYIVIDLD